MGRTCKIARLPQTLLDQVNHRLLHSEAAHSVAAWLNALPEVQSLLAAEFSGQPINEMNVSNWRRGGHQLWLARQEAMGIVEQMRTEAGALTQDQTSPITDNISVCLTARLAVALQRLDTEKLDQSAHLKDLGELCTNLANLRRFDRYANEMKIQREKLRLRRQKLEARLPQLRAGLPPAKLPANDLAKPSPKSK